MGRGGWVSPHTHPRAARQMAVHRLLALLGVVVIAGAMAAGGDGDYVEGALPSVASDAAIISGSAQSRSSRQCDVGGSDAAMVGGVGESDHHDLGDAAPPPAPLPSNAEDEVALPIDAESHTVDDAVIDETIKWPTFYKECDFGGTSVEVETSVPDVSDVGINRNDISSLKVPQGFVVTIYSDQGFLGSSKTFTGSSVHCLVNYNMADGGNWDNQVEAIKITSAQPPKSADGDGNEAKDKEKQQKKEEEISTEKEAKAKIKIREEVMAADQKKAQNKEKSTKDEVSAEAKQKAADTSHGSAVEDQEAADAKQENAKKNEELMGKNDEKNAKSQTEKETKHDIETKREGHIKRTAKEKREKLDTAKTQEVDISEKHLKAQDEGRQKSTKKEEESAKKLYKEKKSEEAAAKVSLNDVDEAAESAEKAERFAKEANTKTTEKTSKLTSVEKDAKGVATEKGQAADKLGVAEKEAKKNEQDAKAHERDSKSKEEKAKSGAEMREKSDEQARKITVEKEKTSKLIRTRVEFATKKAKGHAESANKKEQDAKFEKAKKEQGVKEGDNKEAKHKETLQKAAVEERVQKLASLRKSIAGAEADVASEKKEARGRREKCGH